MIQSVRHGETNMRQLVITCSLLFGMALANPAFAHYDGYDYYYYYGPLGYYGPCYNFRLPEPGFSYGRYNERWHDRSCYRYRSSRHGHQHTVRVRG